MKILLDKNYILDAFKNQHIRVDIFESIDSTQTYLKSFIPSNNIHFCISEEQTHGIGRFNRKWHAPFGENIYLSFIYPFQKDFCELSGLSLVVGLATAHAFNNTIFNEAVLGLKWPNDLMYANKKVGGILVEIQGSDDGTCQAVIGIGINVNMLHKPEHNIEKEWTSLREIVGSPLDRNKLCVQLMYSALEYLKIFAKEGLSSFKSEWEKVDTLKGKIVKIKTGDCAFVEGIAKGIDSFGRIILEKENGALQTIASGDATIAGSFIQNN